MKDKAKIGRPKSARSNYNHARLMEVLRAKKMTLDSVCSALNNFSYSTMRRARRDKQITLESLEELGKYLDVNPEYLAGYYDELLNDSNNGSLTYKDFPYIPKGKEDLNRYKLYKDLLNTFDYDEPEEPDVEIADGTNGRKKPLITNIPLVRLYLELDKTIFSILKKHNLPELRHYPVFYSMPMPPEEEIITLEPLIIKKKPDFSAARKELIDKFTTLPAKEQERVLEELIARQKKVSPPAQMEETS